jgi:hypothetical protein
MHQSIKEARKNLKNQCGGTLGALEALAGLNRRHENSAKTFWTSVDRDLRASDLFADPAQVINEGVARLRRMAIDRVRRGELSIISWVPA